MAAGKDQSQAIVGYCIGSVLIVAGFIGEVFFQGQDFAQLVV